MPNTYQELVDRFICVSGAGLTQVDANTPLDNADLNTRDKCTITREEIIVRRDRRDCRNEDLVASDVITRLARYTLNYEETTPQIMARWGALYLGNSAAPTGTPANEVQTLTRSGTVSGGTFTLSLTLEGRTVTTKPIAFDASNSEIEAALTAARMLFVQPGDVAISGDWGTAITVTFQGRLAKANLSNLVVDAAGLTGSTPDIVVAQTTAGAQKFHDMSRSATKTKKRISFALGWDTVPDRVEKYAGYVVESFSPSANRNGDAALQVTLLGPWDYDSIETSFEIPECSNPEILKSEDCKLLIDGNWETTDVNSMAFSLNDNIPTDRLSAFPFDGMDVQTLKRGKQPTYTGNFSIFGSEVDAVYQLAYLERTQDPVEVIAHFGLPGNRFSLIFPEMKVRFQNNRETFVGDAERMAVNLDGVAFKDGANAPVSAEAYVSQTTAFGLNT